MDWLQWPAFALSVVAAWLMGSKPAGKRNAGFWIFLASNAIWAAWGLHTHATALEALQICLAAMNIRGLMKTQSEQSHE